MTSTPPEYDTNELRSKIQQELINSGKYQQFFNKLKIQLINSGWQNEFQGLINENLTTKANKGEDLKSMKVLEELTGKGLSMVPDDVKVSLLSDLKNFLDEVVVD